MTHKQEMQRLKKHDPILYSELTSDPTHAAGDDGVGCVIFMVILAFIVGVCLVLGL